MSTSSNYEYIKSKDNERVKLFAKLGSSKYRMQERMFLAEGVKLTREALGAGCVTHILISESRMDSPDISELISGIFGKISVLVLSDAAFSKVTTESAPQGIISVCAFPEAHCTDEQMNKAAHDGVRIIALDGIRDPGNLGTIFRSALAFGFDTVIMGDCADEYSPKTVRASMGSLFRLGLVKCRDLALTLNILKSEGRRILGASLSEKSLSLGGFEMKKDDIVVIGNEGHGISDDVLGACDNIVKIPMNPYSESLNAGIAASLIMWEYFKM